MLSLIIINKHDPFLSPQTGVTIPSQRRYVEYYGDLVNKNLEYNPRRLNLCLIEIQNLNLQGGNTNHLTVTFYPNRANLKHPKPNNERNAIFQGTLKKSSRIEGIYYLDFQELNLEGDILVHVHSNKIGKGRLFSFWFNTTFIKPMDQSQLLSLELNCSSTTTLDSGCPKSDRHRHNSMINSTTQSTELTGTFNSSNMHQNCLNSSNKSLKFAGELEGNLEGNHSANSSISSVCSNTSLNSSSSNFSCSQFGLNNNTIETTLVHQPNNNNQLTTERNLVNLTASTPGNEATANCTAVRLNSTPIAKTKSDQNANEMIRNQSANNILNSSFDSSTSSHNSNHTADQPNGNLSHQSTTNETDNVKLNKTNHHHHHNNNNNNNNINNNNNHSLFRKQPFNYVKNNGYSKNGHCNTSHSGSSQASSNCNLNNQNLINATNLGNRLMNNSNLITTTDSGCSNTTVSSSSRLSTPLSNNTRHRFNSGPAYEMSPTDEKR